MMTLTTSSIKKSCITLVFGRQHHFLCLQTIHMKAIWPKCWLNKMLKFELHCEFTSVIQQNMLKYIRQNLVDMAWLRCVSHLHVFHERYNSIW